MKARPYFKNTQHSWPPVAHICDPSYMGGRDQKDWDLKPDLANDSQGPVLKKPITEKGW
jgi:hypothetical protein